VAYWRRFTSSRHGQAAAGGGPQSWLRWLAEELPTSGGATAAWKTQRGTYRPWVPVPGEHPVADWASEAGLEVFCAVLAWSRYRFVRFANDQTRQTTLRLLAECLAAMVGAIGSDPRSGRSSATMVCALLGGGTRRTSSGAVLLSWLKLSCASQQ